MKRYLIVLMVCCVAGIISCKEEQKQEKPEDKGLLSTDLVNNPQSAKGIDEELYENLPTMDFEDTVYNFGDVPEGEQVTHDFTFTNNGKTPLLISAATGSCGCTVADYPQEPVMPGESDVIKVLFNSVNKQGHVEKSLSVTTNSQRSVHLVYIKADVVSK